MLGCGTVGSALLALLEAEAEVIERRTGLVFEVTHIAVRDLDKARPGVPTELLTDDPSAVVGADDVDIVVEMMGGIDLAGTLSLAALAAGKPVVSANKALLAVQGEALTAAADAAGVDLLFEAAVGGGIPVIRPLRESLLGEPVRRVLGIINGTTNFILTRMADDAAAYADALAEAQRLGFAEADPTADVEGHDAAAKLAIIASIAFGVRVVADDVGLEGITRITPGDVAFAARNGYVIKLLASGERFDDGRVAVAVHPALVPTHHPLASVRDSFNAVFIEGDAVGELMFYGRGAGGRPTASAVLGDLLDAAGNLRQGSSARFGVLPPADFVSHERLRSAYYIALEVLDRPGVLAAVAGAFGANGVSIRSMVQEGQDDEADLEFITHLASESAVQSTLDDLRGLAEVQRVGSVLRVVGGAA